MKKLLLGAILSLCSAAHSQVILQDWRTGTLEGGRLYAMTINEAGEVLFKSCSDSTPQGCVWTITLDIACEENVTYPAMFNSTGATEVIFLTCDGTVANATGVTGSRMAVNDTGALDSMVKNSPSVLAIVYPLSTGLFQVARFSMNGAKDALEALRSTSRIPDRRPKSAGSYRM